MRTRFIDWLALTFIVIGAINWGLIGFFQFNLVEAIFGDALYWVSRTIYAIVGICGLYCLSFYARLERDNYVHERVD